jgi:hypothetical protein
MSALPCPVADPFAAADQAYAKISQFLGSEEAHQVKHSDLERQLEGMGRDLMRKLLQAHLDLRQPGKAVGPVRDAGDTPLTPTPAHTRSLESIFGTVEVLCQEDEKSACCTKDEGRSLEQPTRPQIWKGESPFSVNCLYQADSISGACRGNEARSARK